MSNSTASLAIKVDLSICVHKESTVYKFVHRFLTIVIAFSMFAVMILIVREYQLPLIMGFFLGIPLVFIPVAMFLKVPFVCDQEGCGGSAKLEVNKNLMGKWYRHFLLSGHRCCKCNHFIKLPKSRSSSSYDF